MKLHHLLAGSRNWTSIIGVVLVLSSVVVNAQPTEVQDQILKLIPKPVPQSPNVGSLGQFGTYGVSHFTGIPDISIPIFEATSGDLKVPITLRYHASGVKPTDVASWVGLGWSLSAGGQVSRNIRGMADENTYLSNPLQTNPSVCDTYLYLHDLTNGGVDGDPDVYSFSFPGGGGKFIKLYGESFYQVPYSPAIIASPSGGTFEITDPGGTFYRFGTGTYGSSGESSNAPNGGQTAWYLMDMNAPNSDDHIAFDYQEVGVAAYYDESYTYSVIDQCYIHNGGNCPASTYSPTVSIQSSSAYQQGLETIYFDGGSVWFHLKDSNRVDNGAQKALDRIEVKDQNNTIVKTIKFNYGYFLTASSDEFALKLSSLQFKDAAGGVVQEYKFTYHTNSFSWGVTNYLLARDKWGYYNGATSNTDLVMQQSVLIEPFGGGSSYVTIGGATNREVNSAFGMEGVLSRIDFPTGGYTTFDYEANKYYDSGEKLAGGIRVKEIVSYDGSGAQPIVKKYKYGLNESGYGVPNWAELQYNYMNTFLVWNEHCSMIYPGVDYRTRLYSSNSAFSLDGFDNAPLRYNYVTEHLGDPAGTNLGKTVYEYDNGNSPGDLAQVVTNSNKHWRDSHAWKRGKLTKQTVYDNASNVLTEKSITYTNFQAADTYVGIGAHRWNVGTDDVLCVGGGTCGPPDDYSTTTFSFMKYFQHSGAYLETSVTEKVYERGSATKLITKTTNHTLDANKLQVLQSSVTHGPGSIVTVNRYPWELSANSSSTGDAEGIYLLNQKNILNQPIETYSYTGSQPVVSGQLTTFRKNVNNTSQVLPDKIYLWEASSTSTKASTVINGGNNGLTMDTRYVPAKSRIVLSNYDDYGNLLQASRTNDVCASYKYGYNNTLPVAEVTNAQNMFQHNEVVGQVSVSLIAAPPSTSANNNYNFSIDYAGQVSLKLAQSSGANTWTTAYTLTKSGVYVTSGTSIPLAVGTCGQYTMFTTGTLTQGSYNLAITVTNTNGTGVNACGTIYFPDYNNTGVVEFFHENFEEGAGNATTTPHTGLSYKSGDYTVPYSIPNGRSYIVEYWHLTGSVWTHKSTAYTGVNMVLSDGDAIDDVRVYPTDARMKTYTYHTINGMTSSIDENGVTMIYKYDTFGRLAEVQNEKGGIEKKYTYNYKGPN